MASACILFTCEYWIRFFDGQRSTFLFCLMMMNFVAAPQMNLMEMADGWTGGYWLEPKEHEALNILLPPPRE